MLIPLKCSKCRAVTEFDVNFAQVAKHKTPERLAIDAAKAQGWRRIKKRSKLFCRSCAAVKFPKKRRKKVGRPGFNVAIARRLQDDGKSYSEIARRLGVSRQAVYQRLTSG